MDGQLTAQRVSHTEGAIVHTVDLEGGVHALPRGRVFWQSTEIVSGTEPLAEHVQRVREAQGAWDSEATWEGLSEIGPISPLSPSQLSDAAFGAATSTHVDAAVCAAFDDRLFFKMKRGVVYPTSAHQVERRRLQLAEADEERRMLASVIGSLDRRLQSAAGVGADPLDEGEQAMCAPYLQALRDVAVSGRDAEDLPRALQLLDALASGQGEPEGRAFSLLQRLGAFGPDENLAIFRHELRTDFPTEVIEAANAAASKPLAAGSRVKDLTGLLTVAIDDAETSEVDDAFAIRGDTLYVFIADVSRLVSQGEAVDAEAHMRASTAYLTDGKLPMLPSVISEDAASLVEDAPRAAICHAFEVAEDGRLLGFEVMEARCQIDRRLTYKEVDGLLEGSEQEEDGEGHGAMRALCRMAAAWMGRHREGRSRRGALMLQRNEVRMAIDPTGHVDLWRTSANGPARQLVSEMMVAVCTGTAAWCLDNGIPGIFRVQAAPAPPVPTIHAPVVDPAERSEILRRLRPTHFSTRPGVHFTLGVTCYMQVTSPLRRFHDLLMQQQIRGFLRTGRAPMRSGHLASHFEVLGRRLSRIRKAENETRRYWTLKWLSQRADDILDAIVVRRLQRNWLVELTDAGLITILDLQHAQNGGQRLRLQILEVSARRDVLVLAPAGDG